MYKEAHCLNTNQGLPYFISHISQKTPCAMGLYIFPPTQPLGRNVNITNGFYTLQSDPYSVCSSCLLLAARVSTDDTTTNARRFRIYITVCEPPPKRHRARRRFSTSTTTTETTAETTPPQSDQRCKPEEQPKKQQLHPTDFSGHRRQSTFQLQFRFNCTISLRK